VFHGVLFLEDSNDDGDLSIYESVERIEPTQIDSFVEIKTTSTNE